MLFFFFYICRYDDDEQCFTNMGVGMNSTGATAAPMNPYMFAGSQPQQQQTQLYTNLWQ